MSYLLLVPSCPIAYPLLRMAWYIRLLARKSTTKLRNYFFSTQSEFPLSLHPAALYVGTYICGATGTDREISRDLYFQDFPDVENIQKFEF